METEFLIKTDQTLRTLHHIFQDKKLDSHQKETLVDIINLIEIISQKSILEFINLQIQNSPRDNITPNPIDGILGEILMNMSKRRYLEKHSHAAYILYKYSNEIDIFLKQNATLDLLYLLIEKYKPLEIQIWNKGNKSKRGKGVIPPVVLLPPVRHPEKGGVLPKTPNTNWYKYKLDHVVSTLMIPLNKLQFRLIINPKYMSKNPPTPLVLSGNQNQ